MITVACVMRSGGDFEPAHAWALARCVHRFLHEPYEFKVLTDCTFAGQRGIKLQEGLPGWWSKMELFRPGVFSGRVLYFDLDTVLVGPIDEIALYEGPLAVLSDFYRPNLCQSGVMAWMPGLQTTQLWERFMLNPLANMMRYRGDGQFIHAYAERPDRLQDIFPDQIVSYKRHVCRDGTMPPRARVVCFHGRPRPWETLLWEDGI